MFLSGRWDFEQGGCRMKQAENQADGLARAIAAMDVEAAAAIAAAVVTAGCFTLEWIEKGITAGMGQASRLYEEGEYFLPELLVCAEAAETATRIFRPLMAENFSAGKGRVIIGSVQGDTHDIGKNIVALVIRSAGYEVMDLGRDVPASMFVEAAETFQADVIALAALMTTSMPHMESVIHLLQAQQVRERYFVLIGGKPVSAAFARRIGADGYAESAGSAVRWVEKVTREKQEMCRTVKK